MKNKILITDEDMLSLASNIGLTIMSEYPELPWVEIFMDYKHFGANPIIKNEGGILKVQRRDINFKVKTVDL